MVFAQSFLVTMGLKNYIDSWHLLKKNQSFAKYKIRQESSQAQNGQSNGKNSQNGRRSSINARCYSLFLFIEGVVDGSKQWISGSTTFSPKIIGVYGPSHDPGQIMFVGEVSFNSYRFLIIIRDPLETFVHVGCLVRVFPGHCPWFCVVCVC